jgi:hypothetical protein
MIFGPQKVREGKELSELPLLPQALVIRGSLVTKGLLAWSGKFQETFRLG